MERIKTQLKFHEGVRSRPYKCTAGKITIGVGRNLDDRGLTDAEIDMLLDNDIQAVQTDLDNNLSWWRSMNEVRQRCLIDLVFNLGINRFMKFKRTIAHLQNEEWILAGDELLDSNYARQVGKRANRIADMIRTGEDTTDF